MTARVANGVWSATATTGSDSAQSHNWTASADIVATATTGAARWGFVQGKGKFTSGSHLTSNVVLDAPVLNNSRVVGVSTFNVTGGVASLTSITDDQGNIYTVINSDADGS